MGKKACEKLVFCSTCKYYQQNDGLRTVVFPDTCYEPSVACVDLDNTRWYARREIKWGDPAILNGSNDCPLHVPNRRTRLVAWLRKVMGK